MSFRAIFELQVEQGSIAIAWVNSYSGIVVKTWKTALIFDPINLVPDEYTQVDAIIITHEHLDHFDAELATKLQEKTNALILTTPFVA